MSIVTNSTVSTDTGTGTLSFTGIGSNLDVNSIMTKLMAANSKPLDIIKKQQSSYQTQLSAIGKLTTELSAFQQSLSTLSNPTTFSTLSATSSNASVVSASVKNGATSGNYQINVTQLAQAQRLSSEGQFNASSSIGSGETTTIEFQFGSIQGSATDGKYNDATFTPDSMQATGSIKITSANNTLRGIANAINTANIGVRASIVGDGSAMPYHLVLDSATAGANSALKISVTGDAALKQMLSNDPAGTQHFTQISPAQNAALTINGIAVTSAGNTVTDAVEGLTFNINSTGNSTLNVASNTTAVIASVNSFVSSYNSLSNTIAELTSYNATTKLAGPMLGNAAVRTIQSQIRAVLNQPSSAGNQGINSLSQIGITVQNDGSLTVNNAKLQSALNTNFKAVGALFSSSGTSNADEMKFITASSATQAGSFSVSVTNAATHGAITGSLNLQNAQIAISKETAFNVTLDGVKSEITLPVGNYTATQFAAVVQAQINGNKKFSDAGLKVTASVNSAGQLNIQSDSYGNASEVQISDNQAHDLATIFTTHPTTITGKNVAGTINGVVATGIGQVLTGAVGTEADGLTVQINGDKTGAIGNISYTQGYAFTMNKLLTSHLSNNGSIKTETKSINTQLSHLQDNATRVQSQLNAMQRMYQMKFAALDNVLTSMTGKQNFLTSQIDVLNGKRNS